VLDFRIRASYAVDREFDLLGGLLLSDQDQQESVCLFPWLLVAVFCRGKDWNRVEHYRMLPVETSRKKKSGVSDGCRDCWINNVHIGDLPHSQTFPRTHLTTLPLISAAPTNSIIRTKAADCHSSCIRVSWCEPALMDHCLLMPDCNFSSNVSELFLNKWLYYSDSISERKTDYLQNLK